MSKLDPKAIIPKLEAQIAKAIELGETATAKRDLEILERLVKLQNLKTDEQKPLSPIERRKERDRLMKELEERFQRISSQANDK